MPTPSLPRIPSTRQGVLAALLCSSLAALAPAHATETEHLGLRVLPAATSPVIDGDAADWDLSGGIFACGDVENQREQFAMWAHAAWDADHLYLLARFRDPTPLNNPGQVEGDYGFAGDSLQFRVIVGSGDQARGSHWTCWRGRDGKTIMDVAYGVKFDQGALKDAQTKGAQQGFKIAADRSGYAQEIAIPWALIAPAGFKPSAGAAIRLTFEPNFTVGTNGRLTVKELFAPGQQVDRVFTFMSPQTWGSATLVGAGAVAPAPVRLSDRREFAVHLDGGVPVVDWTGLVKQKTLAGHKRIAFTMPFDGYISLNILAADGSVARQLLNTAFYAKGAHEVLWDGLTTFSWRDPGEPVPAGTYTWQALVHPGLGLSLVGWAANSGSAPWDGPTGKENWGGDEGLPISAASAGDRVLLGWSFAEAGKAMVACDLDGAVRWKHSRQGMSGCTQVASDGKYVFGVNGSVYRIALADGSYVPWPGRDSPDLAPKDLLDSAQHAKIPDEISAIAANGGTLVIAVAKGDALLVVDAVSGALRKVVSVPAVTALAARDATHVYASSNHDGVVLVDTVSGQVTPFAAAKDVWGLACDASGVVYAAVRGGVQQVVVFDAAGKQVRAIGRAGGRTHLGPWDATGLRDPHGITVDGRGQLWVTEEHGAPKRISVWNAATGAFVKELFGPTSYGALGGSISHKDPLTMAGLGCEWKIDGASGRATCVGVIDDEGFQNSRFATGANGREYLVTAANWAFDLGPVKVYERTALGVWKLRAMIVYRDKDGQDLTLAHGAKGEDGATTRLWADRNDDGKVDADEFLPAVPGLLKVSGWYMNITPDLTLYAGKDQFRTSGFTSCGAPLWDLTKPVVMPAGGLGSGDGKLVLAPGEYGVAHGRFRCLDIATGAQRWWYPDTFVGVHGSHNAPPAEVGMIRGSYGPCSAVTLPAPIGDAWVIATNVGEWHILTAQGFYLGRLFEPDQTKVAFPAQAVPGARLDAAPCGMGGEDFGGSATVGADGRLYLAAGKTGFWNVRVEHLDQVKLLTGSAPLVIAPTDLALAQGFKEAAMQAVVGVQRVTVRKATPTFTGDIAKDFAGAQLLSYEKGDSTRVRSAIAWDDAALHLAWEVQDRTPWSNGARSADALYWGGDTVDFQLGTDAAAPAGRGEAALGDLRLSIGALAGTDTAVVFRKVATDKHPKTFTSGVVKDYTMDSVVVLADTKITVTKRGDGYTVEATIPLAALGFTPRAGLTLRGDVGVTFGDQSGTRTRLRSYWSSQHTGIVDDVVYELMMEPKFWGEVEFE